MKNETTTATKFPTQQQQRSPQQQLPILQVRVCQNKHCHKQYPALYQTVANLLNTGGDETETTAVVQSSGCLSHCEQGPNAELCIISDNHKKKKSNKDKKKAQPLPTQPKICHSWKNPSLVAEQLEQYLQSSHDSTTVDQNTNQNIIPTVLIAACKVMDQAQAMLEKSDQPETAIRYLSSVITKLEQEEKEQQRSTTTTALAQAYALRAKARAQQLERSSAVAGSSSSATTITTSSHSFLLLVQQVIQDAHKALELLGIQMTVTTEQNNHNHNSESVTTDSASIASIPFLLLQESSVVSSSSSSSSSSLFTATSSTISTAFRAWLDVLEWFLRQTQQQEQRNAIVVVLQQQGTWLRQAWSHVQPSFRTKLQQEQAQLQQ